jgi:hypothetical protein
VEKIKVLLFAANPRGTDPLDLHREFREIDEEIRLGKFRDALELIIVPGTRLVDLIRRLNEDHPHIVHFSGHGNIDEEIILERGHGELEFPDTTHSSARDMQRLEPVHHASGACSPRPVSKSALVDVLKACNENIHVVVLNACHTRPQAEAISEVIDCAISMNRVISDVGAIKFAASFYGALAFGRSVKNAFDQGLARLRAEDISETDTPELVVRAGVDPSAIVLVGPREDAEANQRKVARTHNALWITMGIAVVLTLCYLIFKVSENTPTPRVSSTSSRSKPEPTAIPHKEKAGTPEVKTPEGSPAASNTGPGSATNGQPREPDSPFVARESYASLKTGLNRKFARPGDVVEYYIKIYISEGYHIHQFSTHQLTDALGEFLPPLRNTQFDLFRTDGLQPDGEWIPQPKPTYNKEKFRSFVESGRRELDVGWHVGEVTWTISLRVPLDASPGNHTIQTQIEFQVCDISYCAGPGRTTLEPVQLAVLPPEGKRGGE